MRVITFQNLQILTKRLEEIYFLEATTGFHFIRHEKEIQYASQGFFSFLYMVVLVSSDFICRLRNQS